MGQSVCCSKAGQGPSVTTLHAEYGVPLWHDSGPSDLGPPSELPAIVKQKGLVIWANCADDLVGSMPFELYADVDHLYAPPGEVAGDNSTVARPHPIGKGSQRSSPQVPVVAPPDFVRDLGVWCRPRWQSLACGEECTENQDNYACVQVEDACNPWGLYVVADGHGQQGHLVSTLLVHEFPGILVQNTNFQVHPSKALYEAFVEVGELASMCQFVDASVSGSTLTAALLRDGVLHIAWVGDSKAVLGRLATRLVAREPAPQGCDTKPSLTAPSWVLPRRRPPRSLPGQVWWREAWHTAGALPECRLSLPPLRAIELTSDHVLPEAMWTPRGGTPQATPRAVATPLATPRSAATPLATPRSRATPLGTPRAGGALTARSEEPPSQDSADGAGGPPPVSMPYAGGVNGPLAHRLSRSFGDVALRGIGGAGNEKRKLGGGDAGGGREIASTPEVRRIRLRPEDAFVVLGTCGLWKRLSPSEAVEIVGKMLDHMAADSAEALAAEAARRVDPAVPAEDISVVVLYFQGDLCVRHFDPSRAKHVPEKYQTTALEVPDLAQCGCLAEPFA